MSWMAVRICRRFHWYQLFASASLVAVAVSVSPADNDVGWQQYAALGLTVLLSGALDVYTSQYHQRKANCHMGGQTCRDDDDDACMPPAPERRHARLSCTLFTPYVAALTAISAAGRVMKR